MYTCIAHQAAPATRMPVLVVDDHPVVRQGLGQIINHTPDLYVCGEAATPAAALALVAALAPRVMVLDLSLQAGSGFDLLASLRQQAPRLPVLVLSVYDEGLYAERALRAGARGYLMKEEAPEELVRAIRRVRDGELVFSTRILAHLAQTAVERPAAAQKTPLARLSTRELDVLRFLGQGYTTRRIADTLHVSIKTVETHRSRIMHKLHLRQGTDLLRYAILWEAKERPVHVSAAS